MSTLGIRYNITIQRCPHPTPTAYTANHDLETSSKIFSIPFCIKIPSSLIFTEWSPRLIGITSSWLCSLGSSFGFHGVLWRLLSLFLAFLRSEIQVVRVTTCKCQVKRSSIYYYVTLAGGVLKSAQRTTIIVTKTLQRGWRGLENWSN